MTRNDASKSYRGQFLLLASVSAAFGAFEVATGATTTGVFFLVLAVVLGLRIVGKLPPKRLARLQEDGMAICPRCHERKLTADPDEKTLQYCWACSATVDASDAVVSP